MAGQTHVKNKSSSDLEISYEAKTEHYFAGVRDDMLDLIHEKSLNILEIGCGKGATGKSALERNIAEHYIGIELMKDAADEAKKWLSHVEVGDVEKMDLNKLGGPFDVIICSEVLEHLFDPWTIVEKLTQLLEKGGIIIASSPNIACKAVIMALLRGNFEYTEFGIMDRTHLRWFAPKNYHKMFEDAGLQIEVYQPVREISWKAKFISNISFRRLDHLFWNQIMIKAKKL